MKKKLAILLIICLAAAALSGCKDSGKTNQDNTQTESPSGKTKNEAAGTGWSGSETVTVRAASLSKEIALPFYIIHENGWDVENGFEIELSAYDSGSLVNEALGAGLWDVAALGSAAISSMAKYDCVQLMQFQDCGAGMGAIVRKDSGILSEKGYNPDYPDVYGSPDTVKDATILVAVGSGNHMQISSWLQALGLTDADVNLVHMEFAQAWQAFNAGEGDVFATTYPYTAYAIDEGYVFASDFETLDVQYGNNIICTREFYEKNPDTAAALLQQIIRANDVLKDVDTAAEWMVKWYGVNGNEVDQETARTQMEVNPYFGTEDVTAEDFDNSAMISVQADFSFATGAITQEEYDQVLKNIDVGIFDKAVADLK